MLGAEDGVVLSAGAAEVFPAVDAEGHGGGPIALFAAALGLEEGSVGALEVAAEGVVGGEDRNDGGDLIGLDGFGEIGGLVGVLKRTFEDFAVFVVGD